MKIQQILRLFIPLALIISKPIDAYAITKHQEILDKSLCQHKLEFSTNDDNNYILTYKIPASSPSQIRRQEIDTAGKTLNCPTFSFEDKNGTITITLKNWKDRDKWLTIPPVQMVSPKVSTFLFITDDTKTWDKEGVISLSGIRQGDNIKDLYDTFFSNKDYRQLKDYYISGVKVNSGPMKPLFSEGEVYEYLVEPSDTIDVYFGTGKITSRSNSVAWNRMQKSPKTKTIKYWRSYKMPQK